MIEGRERDVETIEAKKWLQDGLVANISHPKNTIKLAILKCSGNFIVIRILGMERKGIYIIKTKRGKLPCVCIALLIHANEIELVLVVLEDRALEVTVDGEHVSVVGNILKHLVRVKYLLYLFSPLLCLCEKNIYICVY